MTRLNRILIATDLDDLEPLVEAGRALSNTFAASLHILHVVTEPLREMWACDAPGAAILDLLDRRQREARSRMRATVRRTERERRPVTLATAWGDPTERILGYAREHDIDLIVCGTHGRRGLDRLALGSVAELVVRRARCPVLTLRTTQQLGSLEDARLPQPAVATDAVATD